MPPTPISTHCAAAAAAHEAQGSIWRRASRRRSRGRRVCIPVREQVTNRSPYEIFFPRPQFSVRVFSVKIAHRSGSGNTTCRRASWHASRLRAHPAKSYSIPESAACTVHHAAHGALASEYASAACRIAAVAHAVRLLKAVGCRFGVRAQVGPRRGHAQAEGRVVGRGERRRAHEPGEVIADVEGHRIDARMLEVDERDAVGGVVEQDVALGDVVVAQRAQPRPSHGHVSGVGALRPPPRAKAPRRRPPHRAAPRRRFSPRLRRRASLHGILPASRNPPPPEILRLLRALLGDARRGARAAARARRAPPRTPPARAGRARARTPSPRRACSEEIGRSARIPPARAAAAAEFRRSGRRRSGLAKRPSRAPASFVADLAPAAAMRAAIVSTAAARRAPPPPPPQPPPPHPPPPPPPRAPRPRRRPASPATPMASSAFRQAPAFSNAERSAASMDAGGSVSALASAFADDDGDGDDSATTVPPPRDGSRSFPSARTRPIADPAARARPLRGSSQSRGR